jgi:hypothetical protein
MTAVSLPRGKKAWGEGNLGLGNRPKLDFPGASETAISAARQDQEQARDGQSRLALKIPDLVNRPECGRGKDSRVLHRIVS